MDWQIRTLTCIKIKLMEFIFMRDFSQLDPATQKSNKSKYKLDNVKHNFDLIKQSIVTVYYVFLLSRGLVFVCW